jgi:TusA-related sulfurtransferase
MAKRRLEAMKAGRLVVLVDSGAARENVTRLAKRLGWDVQVTDEGEQFRLEISKR